MHSTSCIIACTCTRLHKYTPHTLTYAHTHTHTHRYSYPFFGCPYPVVVQPPVPLSLNTDQAFTQSYCAFDFATEPQQLIQHISSHPLMVEVWQSCDKSHDLIIGTSKVNTNSQRTCICTCSTACMAYYAWSQPRKHCIVTVMSPTLLYLSNSLIEMFFHL